MAAQQYGTDRDGNRIIEPSRRPDGSMRKEIKVRPGYIPLDEQARFTTQGARARQGVQIVPGLDNAELEGAKPSANGAQHKPAARRRRPKKASDGGQEASAASGSSAAPETDTPAAELTRLKLAEPQAAASAATEPGAASAAAEAGLQPAEKLMRALRKKLTACETLTSRKAAGESLSGPELDKLAKAVGWQRELEALESSLQ